MRVVPVVGHLTPVSIPLPFSPVPPPPYYSLNPKTLSIISSLLSYELSSSHTPPSLFSFLSPVPAHQSLVDDILLALVPCPAVLTHLLRTSYTADACNGPVRRSLASLFDSILGHIDGGILEYFLAKGLVKPPKPTNDLSSAFHSAASEFTSSDCSDPDFVVLLKTLQSTASFSSESKAYATALNLPFRVPGLTPLSGAHDVYTLQRIGFKYYPAKLTRLGLMGRVEGLGKEVSHGTMS